MKLTNEMRGNLKKMVTVESGAAFPPEQDFP